MSATAVFIAAKANEQIITIKEASLGYLNIQKLKLPEKAQRPITEETIQKVSKNILLYEFHLLAILDYDFIAPLPYSDIFRIISQNYNVILLRVANNFANDSFRTRVCLKHSALVIAEACVFLAAEYLQVPCIVIPNYEVVGEIINIYNHFI